MEYTSDERPNVRVIRFQGDLEPHDDPELRRLFVQLRDQGTLNVVFDLTKVGFFGSTTLGTLVWGKGNLREVGGDLRLCGLQPFVQRRFEWTELDKAFRIFVDCEEAAASY